MADPLAEMYGIAEPSPLQQAASRRAADAAEALRRKEMTREQNPPTQAEALAQRGGVLQQAEADASAIQAQEAEIAARHQADAAGMPMGPGAELGLQAQAQRQGAYDLAAQVAAGQRTVRTDRAMYEPTKEYIEGSRELAAQRPEIVDQQYMTQAAKAEDAAVLANEAHRQQAEMELRQQFLAEQQARKRDEIDQNLQKYTAAADKASAEFAKVDKFEPGKAWADKSVGFKIATTLAALGRGMRGGNPSDIFQEVMNRELEAHRQTRADAKENLDRARGDVAGAINERQQYLALTQDERTADAMLQASTMRKIAAKMDAMEAEWGPQVVTDQWMEARNTAEQMKADADLRLAELEANNPKYTMRSYNAIAKPIRDLMMQDARMQLEGAGEAAKQYSGIQRDAAKAGLEGQGRLQMQEQKERFDQKKWLAKETEDLRTEIDLINEFNTKYGDDIPGIHALSRVTPDVLTRQFQGNRDARKELQRIVMLRLRRESGAAISEEELARDAEAVVGAMSEEDVRNDLQRRLKESSSRMDYLTRATSEDLEAEYLNRPVGPRAALTQGGGGGPASLVLDE